MRKVYVYIHDQLAGTLTEIAYQSHYCFDYLDNYNGPAVALSMPTTQQHYDYDRFPPFFDGLLPEGYMLEALLKQCKLDRHDYFGQLTQVGHDCVGAVTVEAINNES